MKISSPPKLFQLSGRIRGPRGMSVHGLKVEVVGTADPCRVIAAGLTSRQGRYLIEIVVASDSTPELATVHVRDRNGRLVRRDRRKLRVSSGRRQISLLLKKEALLEHNSQQVSWPEVSGRLVSDQVLDEVRAALDALATNKAERRTFAAVLDAAAPRILSFKYLLNDAALAIQGDIGALDRVAAALQLSEADEPLSGETTTSIHEVTAPHEEIELAELGTESPVSRILEPERLVLLGAAAALAGKREGGSVERSFQAVNRIFSELRGYASLAATVLLGLYGDWPEFEHGRTLMMMLGGFGPGLHDGEDIFDFGPDKPREILDITLNDPKVFKPLWDETVNFGLCAFLKTNEALPTYHINSIEPAGACAGDTITISGHGFGTKPGYVAFSAPGGLSANSMAVHKWSDTEIQVTVPINAICGNVFLVVVNTVTVCGPALDLNPAGTGSTFFSGGLPAIKSFAVNGHDSDDFCLAPGDKVTVSWNSCGDKVTAMLLGPANAVLAKGGPQLIGKMTYELPTGGITRQLRARIEVTGKCSPEPVTKQIQFWVQRKPALSIDGIEVTQAIQYYRADKHLDDPADRGPDNSLRLMAGKSALVRVYLRSGQDLSWDNGKLADVGGKLHVERLVGKTFQKIDVIDPPNSATAISGKLTAYKDERGNLANTLNFMIPGKLIKGRMRLTAAVVSPKAKCGGGAAAKTVEIDAPLRKRLRLRAVRYDYKVWKDGKPLLIAGHPANWIAKFISDTAVAYALFPVAEPGFGDISWIPTPQTLTVPLNDAVKKGGGCTKNWDSVLSHLTKLAFLDGFNLYTVYVAYLPAGIPIGPVGGCGSAGVAAVPAGQQMTMAHEIGHAVGLPHSPAGVAYKPDTPLYPVYEPYDMITKGPKTIPTLMGPIIVDYQLQNASIGEYGVDMSATLNVLPPAQTSDLMSYKKTGQWISIWNHRRLSEQPTPYVYAESTSMGAGANEPSSFVVLFGQANNPDDMTVTDVVRLATRQAQGELTDLVAELLDDGGNIVASGNVFAQSHLGGANGEPGESSPQTPFRFVATIPDEEPGAALRIRRGETELWRRERPVRPVILSELSVDVLNDELTIAWTTRAPGEHPVQAWLACSDPDGADRTGLAAAVEADNITFALEELPAGARVFEVSVTDGFFTDRVTSDVIDIPPPPKAVAILSPRDGQEVEAGAPLRLWGFADSEEDASFKWTIDGKQIAGEPDSWVVTPSRPGRHEVRLEVGGTVASASFAVLEPDAPIDG